MNTITDTQYRDAAKRIYLEDPDMIEIDDTAPVVKGSTNGAFVQAWVWVHNERVDNGMMEERETNP